MRALKEIKDWERCCFSSDAAIATKSRFSDKRPEAIASFPFVLHVMACVIIVYSSKSQQLRLTSIPVPGKQNINE